MTHRAAVLFPVCFVHRRFGRRGYKSHGLYDLVVEFNRVAPFLHLLFVFAIIFLVVNIAFSCRGLKYSAGLRLVRRKPVHQESRKWPVSSSSQTHIERATGNNIMGHALATFHLPVRRYQKALVLPFHPGRPLFVVIATAAGSPKWNCH